MTVRYVGIGGSNANSGLTWALRKLTLNGAEDTPVAAGDTVYVGAGTYRETLTVDVSGTVGNPISYIGDYDGANTDGVGGVVTISGSDDDLTTTRAAAISAASKNYRTFTGFHMNSCTASVVSATGTCTNWVISKCSFETVTNNSCIIFSGAQSAHDVNLCFFRSGSNGVQFTHTSVVDNAAHTVKNSIFLGTTTGVNSDRVGGITVINNTFSNNSGRGVRVSTALTVGQTMTVNNCVFAFNVAGVVATTTAEFSENYNVFYSNATDRTNVTAGANSVAYPVLFDTRWFFEMVGEKGRMLTPFDFVSYSKLVNLAGTSPTTTDMRGTAVIGAQREWGALEYDSTLLYRRVIARNE